jgi:hypothetical protein
VPCLPLLIRWLACRLQSLVVARAFQKDGAELVWALRMARPVPAHRLELSLVVCVASLRKQVYLARCPSGDQTAESVYSYKSFRKTSAEYMNPKAYLCELNFVSCLVVFGVPLWESS